MADEVTKQQRTDEATLEQINEINRNIADSQPLIGESVSVNAALRSEYVNNTESPGFLKGLDYLDTKYNSIRRVRGDGNCFYRAALFSYLENLIMRLAPDAGADSSPFEARTEYDRFLTVVRQSKDDLTAVGYEEFAVETFYEPFVEFIESVPSLTPATLLEHFLSDSGAEYYTWYMRLLTAGYLRRHEERFFPFVDTGLDFDMAGYCRREVEPTGRECEQLHIIALTEYLGLKVAIEYLDGRDFDAAEGLSCIEFPQLEDPSSAAGLCYFQIHLLYRPGHYDILYKS